MISLPVTVKSPLREVVGEVIYEDISLIEAQSLKLNITKAKEELSFKPINFIKYQPVSEFPTSTRDFSFSIKDFNKYEAVIDHLSKSNDKYLKDAFVFDFYENKKFNEIKVGVRFIFQSSSTTLSDEEIHKSINKLLKPIIDLDGVSVPGM